MRSTPRRLWLGLACILVLARAPEGLIARQAELPTPKAWEALKRGDASGAAAMFRDALERNPYDPLLHYGAGYAALVLGRHDSAIASLKKALEFEPRLLGAAVLLAQAAYARGDLHLAIRSLERAVALKPDDPGLTAQLEQWRKESALHASLHERPGARFRLLFEGATQQAISDRVAQVLEASYATIGRTLDSYPSETLTVVLYTNRQFRAIMRAPAWAGGGFDGRIHLAVGGALRTPAALDSLVRHEFVHAVIAFAAPKNVPAWVHEGLASVLDGSDRRWEARALRQTREVFALEDLVDGFGALDGGSALVAYAESAVAAELLIERLGPRLGMFLQMLGGGHTVDQALSTLDVRPELFHAEWRRRMGLK